MPTFLSVPPNNADLLDVHWTKKSMLYKHFGLMLMNYQTHLIVILWSHLCSSEIITKVYISLFPIKDVMIHYHIF